MQRREPQDLALAPGSVARTVSSFWEIYNVLLVLILPHPVLAFFRRSHSITHFSHSFIKQPACQDVYFTTHLPLVGICSHRSSDSTNVCGLSHRCSPVSLRPSDLLWRQRARRNLLLQHLHPTVGLVWNGIVRLQLGHCGELWRLRSRHLRWQDYHGYGTLPSSQAIVTDGLANSQTRSSTIARVAAQTTSTSFPMPSQLWPRSLRASLTSPGTMSPAQP